VTSDETQIAGFFEKYEPAKVKLGKALRTKLRKRMSGLIELVYVYENQGSLVFSYSPTEAGAGGVCGFALYPDRVNLFFTGGDQLSKSDPSGLLQGKGKTVRSVAMNSIADFDRPEIDVLMAAALKIANVRPDPGAPCRVVLKAEEQKQRARRAAKTERAVSTPRKAKARR
jgi:hypothetical protein